MFSFSYWEKKAFFTEVDLVVIGSGIVGLNAALRAKENNPSLNILVLERGALPSGASSKNAGFACFGSPSELLDDLGKMSEDQVFGLVERRFKGLERLRKIHGDKAIGYKPWGGFELFNDEDIFYQCEEKLDYLNHKVKDITGSSETYKVADKKLKKFGFGKMNHLLENKFEGQIDTGKLIVSLLKKVQKAGVRVLNGVDVTGFEDLGSEVEILLGNEFSFKTKKLIVCTNGFARILMPDIAVVPARAQVLVTEPIDDLPFKGTFHFDRGYFYFRNIDGRVLFGGGRNLDFKGEETTDLDVTQMIQDRLEEMLREVIIPGKQFRIEQRWSGIMGVGPDKTTIIKEITPNVFCGVRMGGMGVAIGTLVGEEVADLCVD